MSILAHGDSTEKCTPCATDKAYVGARLKHFALNLSGRLNLGLSHGQIDQLVAAETAAPVPQEQVPTAGAITRNLRLVLRHDCQ